MTKTTYSVAVKRPFRLDLTALVLNRREHNRISDWDGNTFCRVLVVDGTTVKVSATQGGTPNSPRLFITLESHTILGFDQQVEAQLMTQKMLGITLDMEAFNNHIARYPIIWNIVGKNLGVRPTRYPSIFEAVITAIAVQDTAVSVSIDHLNQLAETYGLAFDDGVRVMHAFPRAEELAGASESSLIELGFTAQNARTILEISKGVWSGSINLEQLELATKAEAFVFLSNLEGLNKFAVENVLVRGLGIPDVFPMDDRAREIFQQALGLDTKPKFSDVQALAMDWQPFGGYVYAFILVESLRTRASALVH